MSSLKPSFLDETLRNNNTETQSSCEEGEATCAESAQQRAGTRGGGVRLACASGVSTQEVTRNQDSSCLNLGSQLEKLGSLNKDTDALGPPPQIS